jgi:hypothetical protein
LLSDFILLACYSAVTGTHLAAVFKVSRVTKLVIVSLTTEHVASNDNKMSMSEDNKDGSSHSDYFRTVSRVMKRKEK